MEKRGTLPGVSIIIRSMGRATLPRAFASIAAQDALVAEVVLVDAAGHGIAVPEAPVPVTRVAVGHRLQRPRAANAGLVAARGEWLAFLDEDDEVAPTHYATLFRAAHAARLPVAYSATRMVGAGGAERVFGGPFDRRALFRSNYLSIHAPLFHRSLVEAGCRFDESLAVFEDWDFWLQLAMRSAFAFTGEATAVYHAEAGGSGAGAGSNLDPALARAQRERLMAKWAGALAALDALS